MRVVTVLVFSLAEADCYLMVALTVRSFCWFRLGRLSVWFETVFSLLFGQLLEVGRVDGLISDQLML